MVFRKLICNRTETKKIKAVKNKPVYFGLLILYISKIAMYEFWYNMKPKYGKKHNNAIQIQIVSQFI